MSGGVSILLILGFGILVVDLHGVGIRVVGGLSEGLRAGSTSGLGELAVD
jgi:hypothetical protein